MSKNPLVELHALGQSFWYDNIRRKYLTDGTLQRLIDQDGLRGMTSNPSIFEKAIGGSDDYDAQMKELVASGADVNEIYEQLALADIQAACDLFASLYQRSGGGDGFVSLEVSPYLANDTDGTIAEAERLFAAVARPNLMIKIPATPAGIPAIKAVIGKGINVNITLMFNMAHYEAVASAYIEGLEAFVDGGGDPSKVASVASFFVSRVDAAVDAQLVNVDGPAKNDLMGQIAIANAKVVYARFKEIFHGSRFAALRTAGANVQRLLWASTSTKNPAYSDTLYIDELIGAETVSTIPPKTVDAFRDRGTTTLTLEQGLADARSALAELDAVGISLSDITDSLQLAGVDAFAGAFDTLLAAIADKQSALAA